MFDNENNEQNTNNQTTGNTTVTETSASNNNQEGTGTGYGNYQGSGNNSNGNYSGGTYSGGQGYGYGANSGNGNGYGYGGYGSNANNTNTYGNNSNAGGYGNYSNGTGYNTNNTYNGNYAGGSYGTYQYGNFQQPGGGAQPPKKKGTGKKIAAFMAVAMVLVIGLWAAYYSLTRLSGIGTNKGSDSSEQAQIIEKNEDTAKAPEKVTEDASEEDTDGDEDVEDEDSTTDQAAASGSTDSGIAKTETGTTSQTVVTDVTDVVAAAMPSIVSINNNYTQSGTYFGQSFSEELTASGSGIIVGTNETELLIVTNYHVIEGADSLEVQFSDESTASAEVKGTDSDMDLAVIAVQLTDLSNDTKGAIAIATLGDSDALVVGEPAIAIGNALGYGQSVTTGVISAVNRVIDLDSNENTTGTFIQTDAAINPGNSGGALLNINGEVIGINSNKIGGSTIEGMGYAIPISTAKPIIEQLMTEKTRAKVSEENRGYIGISGVSVTSEVSQMYGLPTGVYVATVHAGGGAEAAGLQESDIITEFDGKEISSMEDLQNRLAYYEAGEEVTLTIMRQSDGGYAEKELTVTLGNSSTLQTTEENSGETYQGEPKEEEAPEGDAQQINPFNFDGGNFGFNFGFGN